MKKGIQIEVFGLVQGVGFRYSTKNKAIELGVKGTVENTKDWTVRITGFGDESAIFAFLKWCHHGPPSSKVEKLEYNFIDWLDCESFEIKR